MARARTPGAETRPDPTPSPGAPRASHPSHPPHPPASSFIPARPTLDRLVAAVQRCTACDLYRDATRAALGEGPPDARVVLVGEQPGDQEDRTGRPFVGPAGRVLDEALAEAGLPRAEVYLTNAVKHFKWKPSSRGPRDSGRPRKTIRLHQKPTLSEVRACRPWLEAEIDLIHPEGIVCLGATAVLALAGRALSVTRDHGRFFPSEWGAWLTATLHPSAVLRMPDAERRRAAERQLVEDLRRVVARLAG